MTKAIVPPVQRRMLTDCPCVSDHRAIITDRIAIDGDCWIWQGYLNRDGYGTVSHRRMWQAHRLAWIAFRGPIPEGLVMDHLCRNRACVNPDHLEPVTDRENIMRSEGMAALNARKDVCAYDHDELTTGKNGRYCRACAREAQRRRVREKPISNDPADPRHGTTNGYGNLGCRCDRCRKANADAHRAYMRKRRASTIYSERVDA